MKTNCLLFLLDLWQRGHKFKIFYDGCHCFALNEKKVFDLNNTFKKDFLAGKGNRYILLENSHDKETVKKIFNLTEEQYKILEEYYDNTK